MILNSTAKRVAGFTIVGLMLIVATDYEPSAQLAVAFAWLIFIGLALSLGPSVFDKLTAVTGPAPAE